MACKPVSLLPHVKYELTLLLFPNANAQLWSSDIPELTHSATQQIHRDEVEEGHCKTALSGTKKKTPKTPKYYYSTTVFLSLKTLVFNDP